MKFTEHLSAHITPEWRKQYIQYEVSFVVNIQLAGWWAKWLLLGRLCTRNHLNIFDHVLLTYLYTILDRLFAWDLSLRWLWSCRRNKATVHSLQTRLAKKCLLYRREQGVFGRLYRQGIWLSHHFLSRQMPALSAKSPSCLVCYGSGLWVLLCISCAVS